MGSGKRKLEYKWVIVVLSFLMIFVVLGFCSSNKGLYLTAVTKALGLKRGLFSVKDSLRFIVTAVVYVFFGDLLSRFGSKKLIAVGFLSLVFSVLFDAFSTEIWGFYISGMLLGVGISLTGTTMATTIIRRWCSGPHVGKILGVVLGANGVGGAVAAQIVTPMIYEEGNPFGYRNAYLTIIPILVVTGTLVLLLLKEPSAETASGGGKKKKRGTSWEGIPYAQLKHRPYFYLTLLCVLLTGMILQGITTVATAHMLDTGMDSGYVAWVASISALCLTVTKFLSGACYDRFGLRMTVLVSDGLAVTAMLLLTLVSNAPVGRALAVVYCVMAAMALPLETIMLSLITGDLFGNASFDKLLGIVSGVNSIGFALGAPVLNACYDAMGTYVPMFYIYAAGMAAVTVLFQLVARTAGRERSAVLDQESASEVL